MKTNQALFAIAFPLAMTTLGAGCAAPFHEEEATSTNTPAATSGLTIEERRSDLVRGRFERDGNAIDFTFSIENDIHRAKISDKSGPILESTFKDGHEDTTYLGGKARVSGGLFDEKPAIEGDQEIFEALNAHPSAPLFFAVRDALLAAGVSKDFVSVSRKTETGGVRPQYFDRGTYYIYPNQPRTFTTTWQAWVYTQFTLSNFNSSSIVGCVQALTGWSPEICSGTFSGEWRTGAQYYGYSVKVRNPTVTWNNWAMVLKVRVEEL